MESKNIDLISLLEKELEQKPQKKLDEIGIVVQVGDGICKVYGLLDALYGEIVHFEGGNKGIVLNMSEDFVSVFLLSKSISVA